MENIELAIKVAIEAHAGQVDKAGKPSFHHPIRVMDAVTELGAEAMMVGVLHDVVEDTPVTLAELRELGFPEAVISGVDAMTRRGSGREGEPYMDYIARCALDPLGLAVKRADLADNMSPERRFDGDESLRKRYQKTVEYLNGKEKK